MYSQLWSVGDMMRIGRLSMCKASCIWFPLWFVCLQLAIRESLDQNLRSPGDLLFRDPLANRCLAVAEVVGYEWDGVVEMFDDFLWRHAASFVG